MSARKILLVFAVMFAFLLMCTPAWAGDCSDPSDCSSIPDNGTKAACVGGVIAGYCLYLRIRRKHDEEPGLGLGEADDQTVLFGGDGDGEANKPSAPGAAGKN